eukprot:TRINITY_DN63423_c0_g1_i1.p1 TRINITY_DN63423_c0_g1~~TRINITY_DN63423_c0_g1_i1.p1  ORF type:complete len:450 (-),score=54.65 TRINITY_DN63423_c0_g1_i1:1405-2754(-)
MTSLDQYERICCVGSGSFGNVWRIRRKSDGKGLVWKELCYGTMTEKQKKLIVSEVNILRELRHPNIVRYYDRIIDKEEMKIYIVMEHCDGGDLLQLIKRTKAAKAENRMHRGIPEDQIWTYFFQLCLALKECHNRKDGKILHRDIKPANVLLCGDRLKLGDFGLARVLSEQDQLAQTQVGTPFYMSPEQTVGKAYDEKCDIWGVGCLLYELCQLEPPFKADTNYGLAQQITKGNYKELPNIYSDELKRIIRMCLHPKSTHRPSAVEIFNCKPMEMRMKELKICTASALLQHEKEDLRKKTEELERKLEELQRREQEVHLREANVEKREASVERRERELQNQQLHSHPSTYSSPNSSSSSASSVCSSCGQCSTPTMVPLSRMLPTPPSKHKNQPSDESPWPSPKSPSTEFAMSSFQMQLKAHPCSKKHDASPTTKNHTPTELYQKFKVAM